MVSVDARSSDIFLLKFAYFSGSSLFTKTSFSKLEIKP